MGRVSHRSRCQGRQGPALDPQCQGRRDVFPGTPVTAQLGREGIIAKHRRSPYEPGHRTTTWLKVKVRPEQELVVGGYLPGEGTHTELGALIVGVHEGGRLRYAGRVGSGIDAKTRGDL